ncbi:LysR substrate-binding domain-containing protein [Hydrogenophaga sp.]|uniref:LysR substrate-binding domain-containing protein n=1 Tax=Hydrogenophaga sp. TaxID=1904254 RepID=UPI002FC77721
MTTPRRKLPPLNALRAFEAAARHLSFKEAADELYVTATAVSHQIRHLEGLVGTRLFERRVRSISLTPAGMRLYPVLRDSFDRIAAGVIELSTANQHLRVNTTPAFASKVIVPALAEFYCSHPDLLLSLDATEKVVDLRRGDADLAIRYGRGDHSPLSSQALAADCYLPVCSPQLTKGRPFTPDEVAGSKLLQFAWRNEHLGGPTWGRWMAAAGVDGFEETRCLTLSEESLVIQAAIEGAGVALLSSVLVASDLASGRLVQVHPLKVAGLTFTAVWATDSPKTALIETFLRWLRVRISNEGNVPPDIRPDKG